MSRSALLLVIMFGVGLAVGYAFRGPGLRDSGAAAPAPAQLTDPGSEFGIPEPPTPVPPPAPRSDGPAIPEAVTKTGTITGHIRTPEGAPVPGVLVRAEIYPPIRVQPDPVSGVPPTVRDLRDTVQEADRAWRRQAAARREAVTGSDGSYVLEGVAGEKHRMNAWAKGYLIRADGPNAWSAGPGAVVDFRAERIVVVPLVVRSGEGPLKESVRITATSRGEEETRYWSPEVPEIALPPGKWVLRATIGYPLERRTDDVTVVIDLDRPPPTVTLTFVERPGIRGRVTGALGRQKQLVEVCAIRLAAEGDPDPDQIQPLFANLDPARSILVCATNDWEFAFPDLEAGRWLLGAIITFGQVAATAEVEVMTGIAEVEIEIPALAEDESFLIRVTDEDGRAEERLSFSCGHSEDEWGPYESRSVLGESGVWRVQHDGQDTPPASGFWFVEVKGKRFGTAWAEYVPGSSEVVEIRIGPPAELEVVVEGYTGSEWEGDVIVDLSPVLCREPLRFHSAPVEEPVPPVGSVNLGPIATGMYSVRVLVMNGDTHVPVAEEQVSVAPGKNRLVLPIGKGAKIAVTVSGLPDGAELVLSRRDPGEHLWIRRSSTVRSGGAEFSGLPAGSYTVWYRDRQRYGAVEARVLGDVVAHLEVRPFDSVRLKITDPNGPAARAGLENGDLVTAVDGTEFKNVAQMLGTWANAAADGEVVLSVRREGREFETSLEIPRGTRGWSALGLQITPAVR